MRTLDEQSVIRPTGTWTRHKDTAHPFGDAVGVPYEEWKKVKEPIGGASRFFYIPKASRSERNAGLPEGVQNKHPTVKPIALMRYLCRLITPPGGFILDPYCGSGSTLVAGLLEGFQVSGIDNDLESCKIACQRMKALE